MIKRLKNKIRSARAFSMGEMLVATLILGLMTSALAVGISTSLNVYKNTVTYSEKRMLLSTLTESLSNELRYSKEAKFEKITDNEYQLHSYTSNNFGFESMITVKNGVVKIKGSDLVGNGVYSNNKTLTADLIKISGDNISGSEDDQEKTLPAKIYYYKDKDYFTFTIAVYSGKEKAEGKAPETRTITVKPLETPDTENLYVANTSGGTGSP